ncbi:MAG: hypothetical protein K2Y39_18890 [Candidatus Obscuribacterales bacterium]|nr:hypothetical protein [Candidatus Obscuribacterales bacterium]
MITQSTVLYKCGMRTNIYPLEPKTKDGQIELSAEIETPTGIRSRLWYMVPEELGENLTGSAEPYIIAAIFAAMSTKANVHVHGTVSPFLIRNLMEYQAYWYANSPAKYNRVEITADTEAETDVFPDMDRSICAFSGGLDSCFTIYRHASGICGRLKRNIGAALFVHGFDIPLEDESAFQRAYRTNQDTLKSVGIPLYTVKSNHRLLFTDWNETHAAGIASCLTLFKRGFSEGMIPGTYCYNDLAPLWGSNPTSDHLMSSRNFSIFHDGAIWNRGSKLYHLREWQTAYERIRVCYSNIQKDQNCGRCGKCLITLLLINMLQLPNPCSFPEPLSKEIFEEVEELDEVHIEALETLLKMGSRIPYRDELSNLIEENRRRLKPKKSIQHELKQTGERIKALFGKPPY